MKLALRHKRTSLAKALLWPAALALLLLAAASCGGKTESPPALSFTPTDSGSGNLAPTPTATSGPVSDGSTSTDVGDKAEQSTPELSPTPTDSASGNSAPTPTPTSGPVSDGSPSPEVGSKVGQRAPEFTLTFSDAEPVTLASLREQGKPVVLYFFTTW